MAGAAAGAEVAGSGAGAAAPSKPSAFYSAFYSEAMDDVDERWVAAQRTTLCVKLRVGLCVGLYM